VMEHDQQLHTGHAAELYPYRIALMAKTSGGDE